jgi:tRNA (mo5U34)-methyltransferase
MERLLRNVSRLRLNHCYEALEQVVLERRHFLNHAKGNFSRFQQVVDSMSQLSPSKIDLDADAVTIGTDLDVSQAEQALLNEKLEQLRPWRKGPFNLFGIDVDSEWQSWMKWDRVKSHLPDLKGKRILDIGSSNGYYMFRMAADNPLMVLGLEPQSAFYFQYLAVQKLLQQENVYCLPIPHDQLPQMDKYFDLVFCMGVLYHRKSPLEMLKSICDSIRKGGTLVLENLVINSKEHYCLFPRDRYAKMRNVFFIPDLKAMENMLERSGFKDIQCVDVTTTTFEEQRKTKWIQTETLKDFLDPDDCSKTIEGYPAPVRAIFTATAL